MALTWTIEDVQGATELCWDETGKVDDNGEKQYRLNPLTEVLIFSTMSTGMGKITEDNWTEFYARLKMLESLDGPFLVKTGDDWLIEPFDVKNHIGLKTNASANDKSRSAWFKDHLQITVDQYKSQAIRETRNR